MVSCPKCDAPIDVEEEELDEDGSSNQKKKDKKLVFLSRTVLDKVKERPMTTGT